MRRLLFTFGVVALVVGVVGTPEASAQQQSVNLFLGGFIPTSMDARGTDDVLFNDADFLVFRMKDFNGPTIGGEWLIGMTDWFDAGLGVSFYQRTAPAVDADFVNLNGSEVEQDL